MKEDIYCIACQCQTIINKQIKPVGGINLS